MLSFGESKPDNRCRMVCIDGRWRRGLILDEKDDDDDDDDDG
jgi:hypothetical protein